MIEFIIGYQSYIRSWNKIIDTHIGTFTLDRNYSWTLIHSGIQLFNVEWILRPTIDLKVFKCQFHGWNKTICIKNIELTSNRCWRTFKSDIIFLYYKNSTMNWFPMKGEVNKVSFEVDLIFEYLANQLWTLLNRTRVKRNMKTSD